MKLGQVPRTSYAGILCKQPVMIVEMKPNKMRRISHQNKPCSYGPSRNIVAFDVLRYWWKSGDVSGICGVVEAAFSSPSPLCCVGDSSLSSGATLRDALRRGGVESELWCMSSVVRVRERVADASKNGTYARPPNVIDRLRGSSPAPDMPEPASMRYVSVGMVRGVEHAGQNGP